MNRYEFQIVTGESSPFAGDSSPGSLMLALTRAANHLDSLGYDIVGITPMNHHYGVVFYRRETEPAVT